MMKIDLGARLGGACTTTLMIGAVAPAASAQAVVQHDYDLPAEDLGTSLRAVATLSGRNIIAAADLLEGKQAPPLRGSFTAEEAVAHLLSGSGLESRLVRSDIIIVRDAQPPRPLADVGTGPGADIVVTGSRIRGAPVASPLITVDQEQIRNSGQTTLGEVVRSLPQSFGGGQNPGIGFNVPSINGVDVGGGSSLNLRGLGSDATLTLLNGHRLAYSGSRQSVDVSTIPLGAVDRIEIVADGASALYGSDAVGGVANIILKPDADGLETRARLGASTDGGNFQQQYSATGGTQWGSGGFIAAYEFKRNTPVESADRSYAATRSPGLTLYPSLRNHSALVSAHQRLSGSLKFSLDALFNQRKNAFTYATNPAGDLSVGRATQATDSRAYAIAPTLSFAAGTDWNIALFGSYAHDQVDYRVDGYAGSAHTLLGAGCYCNGAQSIEINGDGPLFTLPGGPVRAAVGAGYRDVQLKSDRGAGNPLNFERSQWDTYAYGELSVPLVGPANAIAGLYRASLSAAVRYERYQNTGSVATPKFGLVVAPTASFDLKASWGRSFRAPTLLQRYQPPQLTLLGAATFGATGAPAGSTALYIQGGNPDLSPERARSWSVTGSFHPKTLAGFAAEISYFDIHYSDRIVTPIGFVSQALSDPAFAAQITRSPSPDMLAAILASGASFVNGTGAPFDPANVIAFIDNSNVNAGRQTAHGVDLLGSYHGRLGADDAIALSADVSYLSSRRQISADQPDLALAGVLFNPPHWRGRTSATWTHHGLALTAVANYIGELKDTRFSPVVETPDQVQVNFTARYRTADAAPRPLRGLDLTLSLENAFNAKPPAIFTTAVTDTPYDSTNFTPLGRVISFGIAKQW